MHPPHRKTDGDNGLSSRGGGLRFSGRLTALSWATLSWAARRSAPCKAGPRQLATAASCLASTPCHNRPGLPDRCTRASARRLLFLLVALLSLPIVGCGNQSELDTTYGRSRGAHRLSLNGTAVLAEMFEQQGMTISSWRRLSPKLEKEDVLIWMPDSYEVPSQTEIDFLEEWLENEPGRTLVYVGREYDAALDYWREILPMAGGEQRLRVRREIAKLEAKQFAELQERPADATCDWFTLSRQLPPQEIRSLSGPWSREAGVSDADLHVFSKLTLPKVDRDDEADGWTYWDESRVLLSSNDRVLAGQISRPTWSGSRIIIVQNGAWLLNLPLVDARHRALASQLVEACQPAQRVCFLESDHHGLRVAESDNQLPLLLRMFTVPPMDMVALHATFLGILYCFAIMPIFGRPRRLPDEATSDFGKHVAAVGDLLERGQDTAYAHNQIKHYRESTHTK